MKKRINPTIFRNNIYTTYLGYNTYVKNSFLQSLLFFQDFEIKNHLKSFLRKYNIMVLNTSTSRDLYLFSLQFFYYFKDLNPFSKFINEKHLKFTKKIYKKVNFFKFKTVNSLYSSDVLDSLDKLFDRNKNLVNNNQVINIPIPNCFNKNLKNFSKNQMLSIPIPNYSNKNQVNQITIIPNRFNTNNNQNRFSNNNNFNKNKNFFNNNQVTTSPNRFNNNFNKNKNFSNKNQVISTPNSFSNNNK